jgi:quinol monooxygenase YgiN
MYVLFAEFTAKPGHETEVAKLINEFAEVVRQEPGNIAFEVYVVSEAPNRFFVFEKYADVAAFERHLGAPEGRTFNDVLGPHIVEPHSQLTTLTEAAS